MARHAVTVRRKAMRSHTAAMDPGILRGISRGIARTIALGIALGAVSAPALADRLFGPVAEEILVELRNADIRRIPAASGYSRPTIRIRSFRENEVPVPSDEANAWNRRLVREMQLRGRGDFEFVEETALASLIGEIERSEDGAAEKSARIRDLKSSARADIVISGSVTMSGVTPMLAYQGIAMESGRILATTAPRRMPFPEIAGAGTNEPSTGNSMTTAHDPSALHLVANDGRYRETIKEAEALLRRLGYDPGPVDGVMTEETRRAIRAYQLDSALPASGRMTRQTVENMRRDRR